jgi:hypothetical protein
MDLTAAWEQLTDLRAHVTSAGFPVTELRLLEVLVWIWADPQRQYLKLLDALDREPSDREVIERGAPASIAQLDKADLRSRGYCE